MDTPVKPYTHKQLIQYEGENFLCKNYGKLGHTILHYPYAKPSSSQMEILAQTNKKDNTQPHALAPEGEEW